MSNTSLLGSFGGQGDSSLMFRNKIINGDMRIDQRNAGAAVTGGGYTYTLDRWLLWTGAASKLSAQRSSVVPAKFVNSLLCTSLSAYTPGATERMWLSQPIEGSNVDDLGWGTANAQSVSISFWVRSSLTGTFSAAVMNSAGNRSYVSTYSVSAANTWEYKTLVIPGDTSGTWLTTTGVGLYLNFDLGSGSNYNTTAGSWVTANASRTSGTVNFVGTSGATLYITGVQLEAETATPFERRPYSLEEQLCQKYTYVVSGDSGASDFMGVQDGTTGSFIFRFPQILRGTPTLTHNATGHGAGSTQVGSFIFGVGASTSSSFSLTISQSDAKKVRIQLGNLTNGSTGNIHFLNVGSSVKLVFSAEL